MDGSPNRSRWRSLAGTAAASALTAAIWHRNGPDPSRKAK